MLREHLRIPAWEKEEDALLRDKMAMRDDGSRGRLGVSRIRHLL